MCNHDECIDIAPWGTMLHLLGLKTLSEMKSDSADRHTRAGGVLDSDGLQGYRPSRSANS